MRRRASPRLPRRHGAPVALQSRRSSSRAARVRPPLEATIRFLLHLLIAALLASTAAIAGYAVIARSGGSITEGRAPIALDPMPQLPEPRRLDRRPSFVPASAERSDSELTAGWRQLTIHVEPLPPSVPEALRATAGVAVVDPQLGTILQWLPLADGDGDGPGTTCTTTAPARLLRIALAPSERAAIRGTWLATTVAADRDPQDPVTLPASIQRVVVHVTTRPEGHEQAIQLRRVGAADWTPIDAYLGEHGLTRGGTMALLVGPGRYALTPTTGTGWNTCEFEVPGPKEITAHFER